MLDHSLLVEQINDQLRHLQARYSSLEHEHRLLCEQSSDLQVSRAQLLELLVQNPQRIDPQGHHLDRHLFQAEAVEPFMLGVEGVPHRSQGGIVDGLSTALMAAISVSGGQVQEAHYNDYKWMRMPDMPVIEVHMMDSDAAPSVGPALATLINAAVRIVPPAILR